MLAEDAFNYIPLGASLDGANGGSGSPGWAGAWSADPTATVGTGLTYARYGGLGLGNAATLGVVASAAAIDPAGISRTLGDSSLAGNTLWMRMLYRPGAQVESSVNTATPFQLATANAGNFLNLQRTVGAEGGTLNEVFSLNMSGEINADSFLFDFTGSGTHMLLFKLVINQATNENETLSLWLDPTATTEGGLGTATATVSADILEAELGDDYLSLFTANGYGDQINDFVIATTFADAISRLTDPVTAVPTTTTLISSASSTNYGASVTFTATVLPSAASGTVTFKDGAATLGTGTLSSGIATFTTSGLSADTHSITAQYSGDYAASISDVVSVTVNPLSALLTLSNLAQTYDGTAKPVSVVTLPTSLTVIVTYNGSGDAPTNAGSYTVVGTISDPNYYGGATNTLVIAPAAATVTLGNLSQIYDGTAKPVSVTTTPVNLAVSVTYNGSASVPINAGSYNVIAVVTDANYRGTNTATGQITPKALSVTVPSIATRGFNGTATAGALTVGALSGFVGSEYVSVTGAVADYASADVGTYPGVDIIYTLHDGTGGGLAANYSLAAGTATGQITPRALTVAGISASDKVYDGTTNATLILTNAALAGNLDGPNVVLSTTNATGAFADPNVGTNKTVQVFGLTLSGSATNNYTFTQPTTNATITGKPLNITANGDAKTYGEVKLYGPGRMEFGTGAGDLLTGDNVTSVTLACADGGPATAVVRSYDIIPSAAVGTGLDNYLIRYHVGVLNVGARGLNLTANADSKTYGTAKPYGLGQTAFSTGVGELVNGDSVTNVTLACLDGGPATAVVGSYHLSASAAVGMGLDNYAIHYHDGVLTVNPKALNLTANGDSKTYGEVRVYGPGQTAFSTGAGELVNGDSVTNVTLACLDGGPATAAVGSYDIIASAALGNGLGNYSLRYHVGTLRVLVANSAMALVSSANPSVNGSNVTFTATVTPVAPATTTPSGSVQFYLNGSVSGSPVPLSGGAAGIIAAFYKLGTNLVAATYLPDGNYVGSGASLEQVVHTAPQVPSTAGIKNNGDGTVTVSFSGTPNAEYVVQASVSLEVPLWRNVSTNVAGADGRWTFEDGTGHDPQRYYRSVRP